MSQSLARSGPDRPAPTVVLDFHRVPLCCYLSSRKLVDVRSQFDRSSLAVDFQAIRQHRSTTAYLGLLLRQSDSGDAGYCGAGLVHLGRTASADSFFVIQEKCKRQDLLRNKRCKSYSTIRIPNLRRFFPSPFSGFHQQRPLPSMAFAARPSISFN